MDLLPAHQSCTSRSFFLSPPETGETGSTDGFMHWLRETEAVPAYRLNCPEKQETRSSRLSGGTFKRHTEYTGSSKCKPIEHKESAFLSLRLV